MNMKSTAIFLLFILPAFCLYAQESFLLQSSVNITTGELKEHVYVLSSDPFGGRYTGSEGQRMAAEYIQEEFREDGLKAPYPGSSMPYFQEFTLEKCYWKDQSLRSEIQNTWSGRILS